MSNCVLYATHNTCSRVITSSIVVPYVFIVVLNNFIEPSALHLCLATKLTDNTVNSDFVTCNRLISHLIVSCSSIPCVKTVGVECTTIKCLNADITICSVFYSNDNTGYIVFVCGIFVVFIEKTKLCSFFKSKSCAISRFSYLGTNFALEVSVFISMTESFNCFLSNKNFVTNGAMLTFCLTGSSTSRSNSRINYFSVTCSRNYFLSNENLVTNGAVLTFCKTCSFASSINSLVNNLGVTVSSNNCLANENFVTSGAVLTFSKTCVFTIGSNSLVNYLCVTKSINCFLCCESFSTLRALHTVGKTCGSTSSIIAWNNFCICMCALCIANESTFVTFCIVLIVVCMGNCRNSCLFNKNCVTN